jgi:hypothetical protein
MNLKEAAVLIAVGLFATAAYSGEQMHHKVEVVVVGAEIDGETRIVLDSDELGFDLHDMQVGENQSIVDKDGRAILITRTEEGFTFEVDGKTIELPAFDDLDGGHVWFGDGDHSANIDVRVMHDGMSMNSVDMEGVMIFSGKEIDEATQQLIRTALESAGHNEVSFAGGDEHGQHHVRVIKKVVKVSE